VLITILLIVLFITLFTGLAVFISKLFIIGLALLPVIAVVALYLMWRRAEAN
jgi:hypothetical protein